MRAEKRRLLSIIEEDDIRNRRDNNAIRLASDQRVHIPAIVLIDCFAPSNIKDLYASIDDWPLRPPAYLDSLKDQIRKWRNSEYGGGWHQVAMFARSDSGMMQYSADPSLPAQIRAVDLLLMNPLPSLTAVVATFYLTEEDSDISERLRRYYVPRASPISIRAKGRIARFTHKLPFSRAKDVYFTHWISDPDQLQREDVDNLFAELEAHCWQWLNRRALGKVGSLPMDQRPSLRCLLLDNLEPFGPIDRQPLKEEPGEWLRWYNSDSDQPYREPHGPLNALHISQPVSAWTTKDRDSFYFSTEHRYNDLPLKSYFSANRSAVCNALDIEPDSSGLSIFHSLLRNHCLGLLSAWTVERLLTRYKEEIALVRDSSAASQSAYRVANMLNDFLVLDGHDAGIIARDAAKRAELEYAFHETPPFVELLEIRRSTRRQRAAEPDKETEEEPEEKIDEVRQEEPEKEPEVAQDKEPEFLVQRLRRQIADSAKFVGAELDMATRSISTSATLLQSMASIRLQWWSLGIALLATVIAVVAIIVS